MNAIVGFVALVCAGGEPDCFVHEAVYDTHYDCEVVMNDAVRRMVIAGTQVTLAECVPLVGRPEQES